MLLGSSTSTSTSLSALAETQQPVQLQTKGYEGFSVKFDPFTGTRLACAASADFGMKGPGRLFIFHAPFGHSPAQQYDTVEGLYDVSWSEVHADVLVTAVADGGVMLFNAKIPGRAVSGWREHRRETSCVEWNLVSRDETFLSTSYDGTIKIWQANHPSGSVATLQGHAGYVYQASWSPREATAILSVGADRSICLWDTRSSSSPVQRVVGAHENEILSVDWNKWDSLQFATGSVDATVRIWDWRLIRASSATTSPSSQLLRGHHRAIRRVKWSPYSATSLASGGYDMALRVWDLRSLNPMVGVWEGHTEFVTGVDFSLHDRSILLATTAWDQTIQLLRPKHWGQW